MTVDQAGPTLCFQSCGGGALFQSVAMRVPWTTPSLSDPRKLVQVFELTVATGLRDTAVGREEPNPSPLPGFCARNDSSEVGVHRQRVLALRGELTPSVRMRRNQLHVNATTATKPTRLGEMSFLFAR